MTDTDLERPATKVHRQVVWSVGGSSPIDTSLWTMDEFLCNPTWAIPNDDLEAGVELQSEWKWWMVISRRELVLRSRRWLDREGWDRGIGIVKSEEKLRSGGIMWPALALLLLILFFGGWIFWDSQPEKKPSNSRKKVRMVTLNQDRIGQTTELVVSESVIEGAELKEWT